MAVVSRDAPYSAAKASSVERRMAGAAHQPRHLNEYIAWFRREWQAEVPSRFHQRGVEPESALGSPALTGAFRAYIMGSPLATDHHDQLDTWQSGAARRYPIHAALAIMDHRWPLSTRALFYLGFLGCEWEDITLSWKMLPEAGHNFMEMALIRCWRIWSQDALDVARESR